MRSTRVGNLLVNEILESLQSLGGWGSLEIFVQNNRVTQITKRAIRKTNHKIVVSKEMKLKATGNTRKSKNNK